MDLDLSPAYAEFRAFVRRVAETELRPHIATWEAQGGYPRQVLQRLGELGLLGVPIPTRYGGQGRDYLALAVLCEELEYVDTAFRVAISVHTALNSLTLLQWGTEAQKQAYLVPQARGERLAGFGLTEPEAGSDAAGIRTTARRDGAVYLLTGTKAWIGLANLADQFLVFARTDPDPASRHRGISAFIVERDFPGFRSAPLPGKLGIRAADTGYLIFEECRVPARNRLGEEGEGFYIAMSALDWGRYTVAAGCLGLIRACLEASLAYARERQAFGQPIGRFQLVQEMIAEMVAGLETSRLLVLRTGLLKNRGQRTTRETSLAKWVASEAAMRAADLALQIHGAWGYTSLQPLERYWRNARGALIYEGTREVHKIIQAEYALGYRQDRPLRCPPPPAPGWETAAE